MIVIKGSNREEIIRKIASWIINGEMGKIILINGKFNRNMQYYGDVNLFQFHMEIAASMQYVFLPDELYADESFSSDLKDEIERLEKYLQREHPNVYKSHHLKGYHPTGGEYGSEATQVLVKIKSDKTTLVPTKGSVMRSITKTDQPHNRSSIVLKQLQTAFLPRSDDLKHEVIASYVFGIFVDMQNIIKTTKEVVDFDGKTTTVTAEITDSDGEVVDGEFDIGIEFDPVNFKIADQVVKVKQKKVFSFGFRVDSSTDKFEDAPLKIACVCPTAPCPAISLLSGRSRECKDYNNDVYSAEYSQLNFRPVKNPLKNNTMSKKICSVCFVDLFGRFYALGGGRGTDSKLCNAVCPVCFHNDTSMANQYDKVMVVEHPRSLKDVLDKRLSDATDEMTRNRIKIENDILSQTKCQEFKVVHNDYTVVYYELGEKYLVVKNWKKFVFLGLTKKYVEQNRRIIIMN